MAAKLALGLVAHVLHYIVYHFREALEYRHTVIRLETLFYIRPRYHNTRRVYLGSVEVIVLDVYEVPV